MKANRKSLGDENAFLDERIFAEHLRGRAGVHVDYLSRELASVSSTCMLLATSFWIFGLLAWTVFQVIFLGFSLPTGNFPTMLVSYGLRGFGYLVHRRNWLLVDTEGNSIANLVGTLQLGTRNLRFQELTTCRAFRHSLVLPSTRSHILVINSGSSSQKLSGSRPTTTSSLLCRASEAFNKLIGPLPFDDFRFVDAVFVRAMARKT